MSARMIAWCAGLAVAAWWAPQARAEEPPKGAEPLPIKNSATLRGHGRVWYVDGPVVIPKATEIGVELGTRIVGINGASLDVQGGFKVRGTQDHWVKIENIDFSPTAAPLKGVHIDMADISGCRFAQEEGAPFQGSFVIENSTIQPGCTFDFRIAKGQLKVMTVKWGVPCVVRCEPIPGKRPDIMVELRSSLMEKTTLHGHGNATVRHSEVKGLAIHNALEVVVDGCDISQKLEIHQAAEESFKKIKLTKCNLWSGTIVELHRPLTDKQKKERVFLQKFYYGGKDGSSVVMDAKAMAALVRSDSENVVPRLDKGRKRKHILVNYDLMMTRVPQLRRGY